MNSMANSIGLPEFIRGLEWGYLLLWAALVVLALWLPKGRKAKIVTTVLVLVVGSVLPAYLALSIKKRQEEIRPVVEKEQAQLKAAMARFEERCKTAGEKIYRTFDDVEGILLMRLMPLKPQGAGKDPMWAEAGLPDRTGDDYLMTFLRNTELQPEYRDAQGKPLYPGSAGYKFVDVIDPASRLRVRYTAPFVRKGDGPSEGVQTLMTTEANGYLPKFGLTYESFVDPEDRKHWVAGGSIQVVDLATNQVIAEKTGFLIDPGQGSTAGFRDPWGWAHSYGSRCPKNWGNYTPSRSFVDQVLKPKK